MVEIGGKIFSAQCIGCSTTDYIWARDNAGVWSGISMGQIRGSILADENISQDPADVLARIKEVIGGLGGVFCPTCMTK